jgi:hypothetical protein
MYLFLVVLGCLLLWLIFRIVTGPPLWIHIGQLWAGPSGSTFADRDYEIIDIREIVDQTERVMQIAILDDGHCVLAETLISEWRYKGYVYKDFNGPLGYA